jgi:outer membrane immunogenic protein
VKVASSKKGILLASVSALALFLASEAKSADLQPRMYTKAPVVVPAPVYSWTGCYVGAQVGYGWGRNHHSQTGSTAIPGASGGPATIINGRAIGTLDTSGGLIGGQVGCNYQFASRWVAGLQGDIAAADLSGRGPDPLSLVLGGPATKTIGVRTDWLASITGRLGYTFLADNRAMVYVKGGGAWAHNKWDLSQTFNLYSPNGVSETRFGPTVGVGLEYMFDPHWTVFGEYNYYWFNGDHLLVSNLGPGLPASFTSGSQQIQTVKVGVNYLFWLSPTPVVAKY